MAQPGHQKASIFPSFSPAVLSLLLFLSLGLSLHGYMAVAAPGITPSQGNSQGKKHLASPPASTFYPGIP